MSSHNTVDLSLGVLSGVDLDSSLGAAEGDIGDGELEGHEGGESLNLLKIDAGSIAGSSLDGKLVGGMLSSKEK